MRDDRRGAYIYDQSGKIVDKSSDPSRVPEEWSRGEPGDAVVEEVEASQRTDIAQVFLGSENVTPEALRTEAARLRKSFQVIKSQLRRWAEEEGLL